MPMEHLPEKQGLVLGCEGPKDHVTALVDTDDIHAMVTAASGLPLPERPFVLFTDTRRVGTSHLNMQPHLIQL